MLSLKRGRTHPGPSQTAGAGQALRARGLNSLSETYASGLQALDDAAALRAENAQLQAELKAILAELEARAPEVIANERELRAMQQAFGAMAGRLEDGLAPCGGRGEPGHRFVLGGGAEGGATNRAVQQAPVV